MHRGSAPKIALLQGPALPQRALHADFAGRLRLHDYVGATGPPSPLGKTRAHMRQKGHELPPLVAVEVLGGLQVPMAREGGRGPGAGG